MDVRPLKLKLAAKTAVHVLGAASLWLALAVQQAVAQVPPEVSPDADISDAGEPTAPAPTNWLETRVAIEELAEAEDFDAAVALGDRLLELTAAEFGEISPELAQAHLLLADVYRQNADYQAAEQEILAAIEVLESTDGPLSAALIDPYLALGDNYGEAKDYTDAISAYSEARNIGRRNFGLLNEAQIAIIDKMTDAAKKLGQTAEAKDLQLEALTLIERNYGEVAPEAIEARYRYAAWLRANRFYEEEARLYYQIERVIKDEYDDDPLMQVRLLRERAASLRAADNGDPHGVSGLYDAVRYLEAMADPPLVPLAQVLTDIDDWKVEFDRTGAIGDSYLQAWQLLGQVENGDELRREWFEGVHEVEMPSTSNRGLSDDPDDPEGHVVIRFTVDTTGRTRDIEVTESDPPGFKDAALMRIVRESRFRPRIIDGKLVPAQHRYSFSFRYDPDQVEK